MSNQSFNPGRNQVCFVFYALLNLFAAVIHCGGLSHRQNAFCLSSAFTEHIPINTKFSLTLIQENFIFKLDAYFKTMCEKILKLHFKFLERQHHTGMRSTSIRRPCVWVVVTSHTITHDATVNNYLRSLGIRKLCFKHFTS